MENMTLKQNKNDYARDIDFSLQDRFIKGYKKNTLAIFLSFSLTITLITALLTLIHTNHKMENIQWQMLFTASDCSINDLDSTKVKQLISTFSFDWYTVNQLEYKEYSRNQQFIFLHRSDDSYITMTAKLESGRMPKVENEVVAERWALLNMGIEPKCNQKFEIHNDTDGKTETYNLVGILSDVPSNKKFGIKSLYAPMKSNGVDNYSVFARFPDNINYNENVNAICKALDIKRKQVKKCPGREDINELWQIDLKMISVLLFICMIVFYGVYRISTIARRTQYGVLRAIGMKRRQMLHMILMELYKIYAVSVPIGVLSGLAIALLISWLSGDSSQDIYLNNERISFSTIIPYYQIAICILLIALFVGIVGLWAGQKITKCPITVLLGSEDNSKKEAAHGIHLGEKQGRTVTLFVLGSKYILKDKKTSLFVILTICVGVVLFTALSYKEDIARVYREDTKEMNYLNGQYEMGTLWVGSSKDGINRKNLKKIETLEGVSKVKTQSGILIRVIDEKSVKRNKTYYDEMNKRFIKYQKYPLAGNDGTDQIYKSLLYGYNKNAFKELKKYVIAGDFSEDGLKDDEIILSVLHTDDTKQNEFPGNYKEGTPLMQYQVGDKIQIKYRTDFDTDNNAYDQLTDTMAKYTYKTYKVVAIVSFAYMYDCNRTIYPLLMTNDKQIQIMCPDSHIQRLYIDGDASFTKKQQEQLERQLINIGNKSSNISTRSMISDITNNNMLYRKQMIYIIGIAMVAFTLVLINMINNLKYRMQIRTREICMYRAIGMSIKMIRRMMIFENGMLGCIGILCGYILTNPVLRYLYKQSDMKAFGHLFHFNYQAFGIISLLTIMICCFLALFLSKDWRTRKVMEYIGMVE